MATTTTTTLPQGDYMKCYAADRYIAARDSQSRLATAVAEQCPICVEETDYHNTLDSSSVGQTDYYNTLDLRRALGTEFFREMECEVVTFMIR